MNKRLIFSLNKKSQDEFRLLKTSQDFVRFFYFLQLVFAIFELQLIPVITLILNGKWYKHNT